MRRTVAAACGDGCSAEGTQGLNLAGRFVIGRCFLRLVHFRRQGGKVDNQPNLTGSRLPHCDADHGIGESGGPFVLQRGGN